jgi:hypothetical protein
MTDTSKVSRKRDDDGPGRRPLVDEELADRLLGHAAAGTAKPLVSEGLPHLIAITRASSCCSAVPHCRCHPGPSTSSPQKSRKVFSFLSTGYSNFSRRSMSWSSSCRYE